MPLLVFTGASQFSAVSVIGAGGSTGSALGGALLLAARNGVYGLTMAPRLPGSLRRRLLVGDRTSAGAYLFNALGLIVVGDRRLPLVVDRCLSLIPAALIAALVIGAAATAIVRAIF